MSEKLLAIAMGGHTTMDPSNPDRSIPTQENFMRQAMDRVLCVVDRASWEEDCDFRLLTHGSGPQTGIIMDRAAISERGGMHTLPLRYATMDLIGSLGMTFQNAIHRVVAEREIELSDVLGQGTSHVVVNPTSFIVDPATMRPMKPIGGKLTDEQAEARRAEGYTVEDRDGKGQRVLVPSPRLLQTLDDDLFAIAAVVRGGALSIAGGTGGLALEDTGGGKLEPRDAVIDKDRAWARIIMDLSIRYGINFDTGVILTDAPVVCKDFSKVRPRLQAAIAEYGGIHKIPNDKLTAIFAEGDAIGNIAAADLEAMLEKGKGSAFDGGAIAKVEAACDVVLEAGVRKAIICCLANFEEALMEETSGTIVKRGEKWV